MDSPADHQHAARKQRTHRCSEPEPAGSPTDKSNVSGGWLRSLTYAFGERSVMKRTLLTILITALVTSVFWQVWFSFSRALDRTMLLSAVQVPGRMALDDIQADLAKGRYDLAEAKVLALKQHWGLFETRGVREGLGRVMVTFAEIDPESQKVTNTEPGAADRSQPARSATNPTPSAAGSDR